MDDLVVVQVVDPQGKLIQKIALIYVITFILIKNVYLCTFFMLVLGAAFVSTAITYRVGTASSNLSAAGQS